MHLTILTLLAAGTSAQFVQSFVPQVAHAYGLEGEGEWHQINTEPQPQHAHAQATPTPSTMISMAKPSIRPMASSQPYIAGMFSPSSSHIPSHVYASHYPTPSPSHYLMASASASASPMPTHRPNQALHHQKAPAPQSTPVGHAHAHGPAVAPDGHIGTPAGGMGVPPSAEAPEPLNAARPAAQPADANAHAGEQSDIAPINPLAPGTNVAPVQVHDKYGADEGNSFCLGQCFDTAEEAQCGPPYGSAVLQSEGCYTCCFSPQNF